MSAEHNRRRPAASLVVLGVCLLVCLGLGVSWAMAATSESAGFARARDEALNDGKDAVVNFNTLDYKKVDEGLKRWEDNSTGPLRDEVRQGKQQYTTQIQQAKSSTTAKIVDAGLTELDDQAGKAKMIAVVQVTVTVEGQQPVNKSDRYQAELTREGDVWKLSALGTVPVG